MASIPLILTLVLTAFILGQYANAQDPYYFSTYIVRAPMGGKPAKYKTAQDWYLSILNSIADPNVTTIPVKQRLLYTYQSVFPGFAAALNTFEWTMLANLVGYDSIYYDNSGSIQTTHTPSFLGLGSGSGPAGGGLWGAAKRGQDAIVGVLDTGIWPESRSFSDAGYSPVPSRWKGKCETHPTFVASKVCNKKLIGARAFYKGYDASYSSLTAGRLNESIEYRSPRDSIGHGTHTASITAGGAVANASLLGAAYGVATGIAPQARLAVYKVCWDADYGNCYMSDILAAFDAAIADGVDVISIPASLYGSDYFSDAISLGSFAAALRGIITAAPAGNNGYGTTNGVQNQAPWVLTVGASTVDRSFPAPVTIGNGTNYWGTTFYAGRGLGRSPRGVIYAGSLAAQAANIPQDELWMSGYCANTTLLNRAAIRGKVVICDRGYVNNYAMGEVVRQLGGIGMIIAALSYDDDATTNGVDISPPSLPATFVSYQSAQEIRDYANATANPTVVINFQGTKLGTKPAPRVASFSGRGPNPTNQEILKPDIVAPGLNILAAFTGYRGPSGRDDPRRVDFNILSGTSMSCAHAAGVAALLKAAHPMWSPAAIKSAIMTTASKKDNTGNAIIDAATNQTAYPLALGSGHISPNAALNPGLIYDISPEDYLDFLCSINYTAPMMYNFIATTTTYKKFSCNSRTKTRPGDLNYPSFSVVYNQPGPNSKAKFSATFSRTVTNIGPARSTYTVSVNPPTYVKVSVNPSKLRFTSTNQKLSYSVTFSADPLQLVPEYSGVRAFTFGSLSWSDNQHKTSVDSPIVFTWMMYG